MNNHIPWGEGLLGEGGAGLESHNADITQGPGGRKVAPWFKPVNIVVEDGIYYASLYACSLTDSTIEAQQTAIWFMSLKDTDHVKLTVLARFTPIPLGDLTSIMSAIANTAATVEIILDQIVIDNLAYFYLLVDKIDLRAGGALFIPSYVINRREDTSIPWKAVHDFYDWIVEDAVTLNRLTEEEGDRLKNGHHVILTDDRFANA